MFSKDSPIHSINIFESAILINVSKKRKNEKIKLEICIPS